MLMLFSCLFCAGSMFTQLYPIVWRHSKQEVAGFGDSRQRVSLGGLRRNVWFHVIEDCQTC